MINIHYQSTSSKVLITYAGGVRNEIPNPDYDPSVKPDLKPVWCKGHVCMACLNGGEMCKHLNYGTVEKKVRKRFRKLIRKIYK
jgi:hypothetical protein